LTRTTATKAKAAHVSILNEGVKRPHDRLSGIEVLLMLVQEALRLTFVRDAGTGGGDVYRFVPCFRVSTAAGEPVSTVRCADNPSDQQCCVVAIVADETDYLSTSGRGTSACARRVNRFTMSDPASSLVRPVDRLRA